MTIWTWVKLLTVAFGLLPLCAWADANTNQVLTDSAATTTPLSEPKLWHYAWSARGYGLGVSDALQNSDVAGIQLSGDVARTFNPYFDIDFGLKARFSTGSTHALYAINYVENGVILDQALLNFNPVPGYMTVTLGAINQRFLLNPLLLDENAFPGVSEKLAFDNRHYGIDLVAQQAIPSSTSLSAKTAEKEPLPSLFTETAFLLLAPNDAVTFHARGGLYVFNELPTQVALAGFSNGNLVDANIPQNADFYYGFRGYQYGGDISLRVHPKVLLMSGVDGLTNPSAPSDYSHGVLTFVSTAISTTGDWIVTPRWEYFHNERQTSPAFYNSPDYGHNNRQGFSYSVRVQSARNGVALKGVYTDARIIEDDPLQANTSIFMFYVELFDANL